MVPGSCAVLDPGLQIRGGPVIQTQTFEPQFGPKIRGAAPPRAPPLDRPPLEVKTPLLLNSSYVLFLLCRSWNNTLENCFVQNFLSPRACVRIIHEMTTWKFSLRATLAKQSEPWAKQPVFQNSVSRVCKSKWGRILNSHCSMLGYLFSDSRGRVHDPLAHSTYLPRSNCFSAANEGSQSRPQGLLVDQNSWCHHMENIWKDLGSRFSR